MRKYQCVCINHKGEKTSRHYDSMSEIKNCITELLEAYKVVHVFENRKLVCRYLNSSDYGKIKITSIENRI